MTVLEALRFAESALADITDEPKNEAKIIVAFLAGIEPNRLPLCSGEIDSGALGEIIAKRSQRTPLQYILGKWWFFNSEFLVGEGVLIPRQDTEHLVETAIHLIKDKEKPAVIDLCSGSGCIAISIAKEVRSAAVTALEKYDEAYEFLLKNIELNRTKNVLPVKADVLENCFGSFDLIVSNPPYIPRRDNEILSEEVKKEPHTALFGGEDGLFFYREITKLWKGALKPDGRLAFEVGIGQAEAVEQILKDHGFGNITVINDLSGIQRVVFGTVNCL